MGRARVLDVGNCDPDHAAIRAMIVDHFDADVDCVMFVDEALARLTTVKYALVMVNRVIFADDSDGMELVRALSRNPNPARECEDDRHTTAVVGSDGPPPVMLLSNFPDAQDAAVAAGAMRGFGKASLWKPETIERLAKILPRKAT